MFSDRFKTRISSPNPPMNLIEKISKYKNNASLALATGLLTISSLTSCYGPSKEYSIAVSCIDTIITPYSDDYIGKFNSIVFGSDSKITYVLPLSQEDTLYVHKDYFDKFNLTAADSIFVQDNGAILPIIRKIGAKKRTTLK